MFCKNIFVNIKYIRSHSLEVDKLSLGNRVIDYCVRKQMKRSKFQSTNSFWGNLALKAKKVLFTEFKQSQWGKESRWIDLNEHHHHSKEINFFYRQARNQSRHFLNQREQQAIKIPSAG